MPSVSFSCRSEEWSVHGEHRRGGPNGDLVLAREDLPRIEAVALKNALQSYCACYSSDSASASVSVLPAEYLDTDAPTEWIEFLWAGDRFLVDVMHIGEWPDDGDEREYVRRIADLVAPLLRESRSTLHSIELNDYAVAPPFAAVQLVLAVPWRGKTAADLFAIGEDVLRLCQAHGDAEVTRETVADLVRGGGAHILIGQPEGNWLDAKAEEYELGGMRGRISLAQAVARFCNAEDGGLIVIGAKAKKIPGGEVIRQVRGVVPRQHDTEARYRRVLDQHLYPPALALRVDVIPCGPDRSLIAIDIPPQPEELKPFLVHGAITAEGDIEGAFISIVQRRGEGSIPITAPMIHASLAAGRALLRGRQVRG